jgi:HAD superfamily hydrolase (TIGR01490 family)
MEITTSTGNKPFSYIAFFDLDRTITKAISGRALARKAVTRGLLKGSDIAYAACLGLAYRLGLADPVYIMEKMTTWVKGLSIQEMKSLCAEVNRDDMLPSVHPEVIDELKMHRLKNARTVILSSTLEPICSDLAGKLKIDDIICSRLEVINGYLTGRPEGKLCYGHEKLRKINEYCEKNNSSPADSWYYADAFVDLPALSLVGFPVCINPDRKLAKEAKKNGWAIRNWRQQPKADFLNS